MSMAVSVVKKSGTKTVAPLLTVQEAAAAMSIGPKAVVRLIDADYLHAIDVGAGRRSRRVLRIAPEEIARFQRANSTHKPDNETE